MKICLILFVALAAILALGTVAQAAIIYSENFDDVSAGVLLTNTAPRPGGLGPIVGNTGAWTYGGSVSPVGDRMLTVSSTNLGSMAASNSSGYNYDKKAVSYTQTDVVILSYDAWTSDTGYGGDSGFMNSSGYVEWEFASNKWVLKYWNGSAPAATIWDPGTGSTFRSNRVTLSIFVDFNPSAPKIWGVINDNAGTILTNSASPIIVPTGELAGLKTTTSQLIIESDKRTPSTQGVEYDNIVLQDIPEPGSLLALATGLVGLVGFARRRAKS